MEEAIKKYLPVLTTLLIICSIAYNFSYWKFFSIDIFSYMEVTDLVRVFISPGIVILVIISYTIYGIGPVQKQGNRYKKIIRNITIINILFIILLWLFLIFIDRDLFYVLLSIFFIMSLGFPVIIILNKSKLLQSEIAEDYSRYRILALSILTVQLSLLLGGTRAYIIHQNKSYDMWATKDSTYTQDTIKYLGKSSEYYMFITKDNKRRIIKNVEEVKSLELLMVNDTRRMNSLERFLYKISKNNSTSSNTKKP